MSNLSKAINDVLAERERQINVKGYSTDHDDAYEQNELVRAASGYVDQVVGRAWIFESHPNLYRSEVASEFWPWDPIYWKPKSPREDLVRAAAILIAEIERLDRKEPKADAEG
ncbi:hypothetical protein SDC64_07410 [Acinetobacter haemolyticus]|uniref:hypothetical protein n=1 Tax=Acinetobacter haemolyticus TaxID=29430 RepID=UPI002A6A98AB|nr:hypothetical protein [Acinetobacter haemolyticus]WPO68738.1 hypothetical protein SDC64_07410 [Acinetobacter haemolyticus]